MGAATDGDATDPDAAATRRDSARPLHGLTFLNTRAASAAAALTEPLQRLGARVIESPTIAFAPPADWSAFDRAAARLQADQWVIFTSATAVRFALGRLATPSLLEGEGGPGGEFSPPLHAVRPFRSLAFWLWWWPVSRPASPGRAGTEARPTSKSNWVTKRAPEVETAPGSEALAHCRLAAVGPGTAEALIRHGLTPALVPERFQGEGLLEALRPLLKFGEPIWHPRAEEAREALDEGLRAAGAVLAVTPCYRTVVPPEGLGSVPELLRAGGIDWLCFTSASTVRNFFALLPPELHDAARTGPRSACLGAITAEAARDLGLSVDAVPTEQDLPGLVQAIVEAVQHGTRRA
jgi:uroporphyrinogen-III synthase